MFLIPIPQPAQNQPARNHKKPVEVNLKVTQRLSNLFYAAPIREPAKQQVLPGTSFRYVSLPASFRLSQRSGQHQLSRIGPTARSPVKARGYYARATLASSAISHVFHALLAWLLGKVFDRFLYFYYNFSIKS